MKKMILRFFPKLYRCLGLFRAEVLRPYNSLPKQYRKTSFLGYLWNYLLYGCDVGEYNCFCFQDRNSKSKKEFVTIRKNRKLDKMFNTSEANKILWDMASFNDYFRHFNKRSYLAINQNTTDEVYAGEMTFNPGGGFTPYYPVSFNEKLGEMFKLPIK